MCISGGLVAAGMAMAGTPGARSQSTQGRTQGQTSTGPVRVQTDGGTSGTELIIPAMPSVPKQPVEFSEWSRIPRRWQPDVAKNLYTIIFESGPRAPNRFFAYGFDVQQSRNVFFIAGDKRDLSTFRGMLSDDGSSDPVDAGLPPRDKISNISQLPGGDPPPPPPSIHDGSEWLPYAKLAWKKSIELAHIATPSMRPAMKPGGAVDMGSKVHQTTPSP
ncbi:hypothetical protein DAT35_23425 [Vitiosangium sp. GDMCC 1.1324]|nr:hypothetical protein DAT35_23425 [Vitiosangium sp. GDMCC 1.1324]